MLVTPKPLTPEQITALEKIKNRHSYYEAEVVHPDGRRVLLCYTPRKTKSGLEDAAFRLANALVAFLGVTGTGARIIQTRGKVELKVAGGGIIRFSGRTKRDVIMEATPLVSVASFAPTA